MHIGKLEYEPVCPTDDRQDADENNEDNDMEQQVTGPAGGSIVLCILLVSRTLGDDGLAAMATPIVCMECLHLLRTPR